MHWAEGMATPGHLPPSLIGAPAVARRNEALKQWKASAPDGCCPGCKDPLPPPKEGRGRKDRDICTKPECRKKYLAVRQQGIRPPTALRTVAKVEDVDGKPGRVRVTFDPCGDVEEMHRSKMKDGGEQRRKCSACAEKLDAAGAA